MDITLVFNIGLYYIDILNPIVVISRELDGDIIVSDDKSAGTGYEFLSRDEGDSLGIDVNGFFIFSISVSRIGNYGKGDIVFVCAQGNSNRIIGAGSVKITCSQCGI